MKSARVYSKALLTDMLNVIKCRKIETQLNNIFVVLFQQKFSL